MITAGRETYVYLDGRAVYVSEFIVFDFKGTVNLDERRSLSTPEEGKYSV